MPPTDSNDDNLQELKPSHRPILECGLCNSDQEYGYNPIRLPNLKEIIDNDK